MIRKHGPRSVNSIDTNIGKSIRAYRLQHDMSLIELGDKLGISHQQVQKYEKGHDRLSVGRMLDICKTFAVTPHELIGFNELKFFKAPRR